MREFTLLVTSESGAFHPADRALMEHPGVTREALLHTDLLADGTAVFTSLVSGDPTDAMAALDGESTVLSSDVFSIDERGVHVYVHVEPGGSALTMLALAEEFDVIVLPPSEFTDEGLRVTLAGTEKRIREASRAAPESISVRLLATGAFDPERDDLVSRLTERQRDVLAAAVDLGYYETPRRATHADVAEVLGCSTGTVGEHLRKVEARVLAELVP